MWATSFTDLAKKAQEASELAARKAQEASFSMSDAMTSAQISESSDFTSLFNLDSMLESRRSQDGGEKTAEAVNDGDKEEEVRDESEIQPTTTSEEVTKVTANEMNINSSDTTTTPTLPPPPPSTATAAPPTIEEEEEEKDDDEEEEEKDDEDKEQEVQEKPDNDNSNDTNDLTTSSPPVEKEVVDDNDNEVVGQNNEDIIKTKTVTNEKSSPDKNVVGLNEVKEVENNHQNEEEEETQIPTPTTTPTTSPQVSITPSMSNEKEEEKQEEKEGEDEVVVVEVETSKSEQVNDNDHDNNNNNEAVVDEEVEQNDYEEEIVNDEVAEDQFVEQEQQHEDEATLEEAPTEEEASNNNNDHNQEEEITDEVIQSLDDEEDTHDNDEIATTTVSNEQEVENSITAETTNAIDEQGNIEDENITAEPINNESSIEQTEQSSDDVIESNNDEEEEGEKINVTGVQGPSSPLSPPPLPETPEVTTTNGTHDTKDVDVDIDTNEPTGSISPSRKHVNFMSPLSIKDENEMKVSMCKSAEKCDSEKDFSFDNSLKYDDNDEEDEEEDEINGMYDDDEDDGFEEGEEEYDHEQDVQEEEIVQNTNGHVSGINGVNDPIVRELNQSFVSETSTNADNAEGQNPPPSNQIAHVPQFAIEKFMSQLERLHEQHEGELQEMERKHQVHLNEMKQQLETATSQQKENDAKKRKKEVAESDLYLSQMRDLEKMLNAKLKKKDEEISGLVDINKLMEEQIDDLKNEAEGLNASLNARNEMLSKMKEKEDEIQTLKDTLTKTEEELESSNEAFTTLKGRVKVVATELKDRRIECRTLNVSVQELTLSKSTLESENKDLATKLGTFEQISEARGKEIENLQTAVTDLRLQVKSKEKELVERGSVGDKALSSYKKKAQSLLANANARAASANQARDDAENDAISARAEAANAVKIAREAEEEKEEVVRTSLQEVQKLQNEVGQLKCEKEQLVMDLESAQAECLKAFEDVKESQVGRDSLLDELNAKDEELEKEIEKKSGLEQDLAMARIKVYDLEDEVANLKLEVEKASSAAFMARQKEAAAKNNSSYLNGTEAKQANEQNDSTIVMLQQELAVANDVIKDLKETLAAMLAEDPTALEPRELIEKVNSFGSEYADENDGNGNDSTPLFFALEKQAELRTARDEITRLAALLGDAESEKMEANEAKEDMRKRMEDAEARLRRFEKLGSAGASRTMNGSTFNTSHGRRGMGAALYSSSTQASSISSPSDSSVNLEYLKNIMLRYMNAMSLNEKKALIPVIGAVLELTADEQAQAMNNIDKNSGIQGVGTTLIENVQNKGIVGGLFGDLL